ncbi:hypothetical protein [Deinococcus knuensis]|uniref:Uncharacterized protein n=1 Tax=Deinococcus knuensis TaxID=1837380 RepID=A0ABQ2SRQ5_9DEIO|nr:hypothetical protein [Deinococcus knuensis]GGS37766.1 hypothetical protein GCM10008961_31620 [Deinococcus knuensis]
MTEPLTPKARHQALEQRVTTLEQASGGTDGVPTGPPRLAATARPPVVNDLPGGEAETVFNAVSALVLQSTPSTLPTVVAAVEARLHVPDGVTVTVHSLDAFGYDLYVPGAAVNAGTAVNPRCLIEFPPVLFGRDFETVTVTFSAPVTGAYASAERPDTPLHAFLRDGSGNQISVTAAATLLPAPTPLVDGPVGHYFLPVRTDAAPGPAGRMRDGYTEVVYPMDPAGFPTLRHRFAGQWWVLPFIPEDAGPDGGGGGVS